MKIPEQRLNQYKSGLRVQKASQVSTPYYCSHTQKPTGGNLQVRASLDTKTCTESFTFYTVLQTALSDACGSERKLQ